MKELSSLLNSSFTKLNNSEHLFAKPIKTQSFEYDFGVVVFDHRLDYELYLKVILSLYVYDRDNKLIYNRVFEKEFAINYIIDENNEAIKLANSLSEKFPEFLEKNFYNEFFTEDLFTALCKKLGFS